MSSSTSDASGSTASASRMGFGMKTTIKMIRAKFPKAKDITTNTLDTWLQSTENKENIVIMDCRDPSEYAVSHMAGAQQVDWENADLPQLLDNLPKDKPNTVVCYCSVGYRSSGLAEKLQKFMETSGKDRQVTVYNLEGSLFQWANEGRAMVDSSGQTTKLCHPYNAVFGKLLDKSLRWTGP